MYQGKQVSSQVQVCHPNHQLPELKTQLLHVQLHPLQLATPLRATSIERDISVLGARIKVHHHHHIIHHLRHHQRQLPVGHMSLRGSHVTTTTTPHLPHHHQQHRQHPVGHMTMRGRHVIKSYHPVSDLKDKPHPLQWAWPHEKRLLTLLKHHRGETGPHHLHHTPQS